MTVSKDLWTKQRALILGQIKADAISNDDGVTVTLLANYVLQDVQLTAMKLDTILPLIESFMDGADANRLFIHQRMATTAYKGIAFNHGFTDLRGGIIMHNGILGSKQACALAVDSFVLMDSPKDSEDAVVKLMLEKENYANVFRIYPNESKYQVLRLSTGSLYTDGKGNYSSNRVERISRPVFSFTNHDHEMPGRTGTVVYVPTTYDEDFWDSYYAEKFPQTYGRNRPRGAAWGFNQCGDYLPLGKDDSSPIESLPGDEFSEETSEENLSAELGDDEVIVGKNDDFFVVHNRETRMLHVYDIDRYQLYYTEEVHGDDVEIQARYMLDEASVAYGFLKAEGDA